jgi:imidazolonepropionase-like amidohydrolase
LKGITFQQIKSCGGQQIYAMKYFRFEAIFTNIVFFMVALSSPCLSQHNAALEKALVIKNVNVIQMTSPNRILKNTTVVIRNSKIESLSSAIPVNATVIDGTGKWLIPGLIDMHVHIPTNFSIRPKLPTEAPDIIFDVQDLMTPFVANGVTTIFNLNSNVLSFAQRREIETGKVIGPRMALAALINGGEGGGFIANTPEAGRQAARDVKAEGYEFIKLYSQLNKETYLAIVDEANKLGLKTVGHIPNAFNGKLKEAFVPNFDMVAHAEEFSKHAIDFSQDEARRFAILSKENGTWLSPTLVAMVWIGSQSHSLDSLKALPELQYVHPLLQSKWITANNYNRNSTKERAAYFDKLIKFHVELVRVFKEIGVPMVAGTDAGVSGVVAGFSLHDEMELLQASGLTSEEVLRAATISPAQWLGLDSLIGTIEVGKQADLILLDANPLDDVTNSRKIAGVIVAGRWLANTKIKGMLADLSSRNTKAKKSFDWKKIMVN